MTQEIEVRRHNGQNEYGPWMDMDCGRLPSWIEELIDDALADGDLDGIVSQGGCHFAWRVV